MTIKELREILETYEKEFGDLKIYVEYNGPDTEIERGDCFKTSYATCDGITTSIII